MQLILWCTDSSGIGCFAYSIHNTSNSVLNLVPMVRLNWLDSKQGQKFINITDLHLLVEACRCRPVKFMNVYSCILVSHVVTDLIYM